MLQDPEGLGQCGPWTPDQEFSVDKNVTFDTNELQISMLTPALRTFADNYYLQLVQLSAESQVCGNSDLTKTLGALVTLGPDQVVEILAPITTSDSTTAKLNLDVGITKAITSRYTIFMVSAFAAANYLNSADNLYYVTKGVWNVVKPVAGFVLRKATGEIISIGTNVSSVSIFR